MKTLKHKKLFASTATIAATLATSALGAGLDRSNQSVLSIFDDPGTTSFSVSHVKPELTGTDTNSGTVYDIANDYSIYNFSHTGRITDSLTFTVIGDQPFGTDILYNGNPTTDQLAGTRAFVESDALSFLAKYQLNSNWSVFGGLRAQRAEGSLALNGTAQAAGQGIAASYAANPALAANGISATVFAGAIGGNAAAVAAVDSVLGAGASTAAATNITTVLVPQFLAGEY